MAIFKALGIILLSLLLSGCAGRVHKEKFNYSAKELRTTSSDKSTSRTEGLSALSKADGVKEHTREHMEDDYTLEVATDSRVLPVAISRSGYTRLTMEDERITDVFVYPLEALRVRIHNQGYLIMVADLAWMDSEENKNKPVYITITGEEGTTQDLSLRFSGKDPEPVKLIRSRAGDNLTKYGE